VLLISLKFSRFVAVLLSYGLCVSNLFINEARVDAFADLLKESLEKVNIEVDKLTSQLAGFCSYYCVLESPTCSKQVLKSKYYCSQPYLPI